jgi:uncharacterized protein YceK
MKRSLFIILAVLILISGCAGITVAPEQDRQLRELSAAVGYMVGKNNPDRINQIVPYLDAMAAIDNPETLGNFFNAGLSELLELLSGQKETIDAILFVTQMKFVNIPSKGQITDQETARNIKIVAESFKAGLLLSQPKTGV